MKKNTEFIGTVSALGSEGEGVVETEGGRVFVPFCLVGETVRVHIVRAKGGAAYGKLLEVLVPSPDRVEPACAAYGKCGGCHLQHMRYEAQLAWKREKVASALRKLGNIEAEVSPVVPCEAQYGYRNKLQLPVGQAAGETVVGFYAPRSHRIVPIGDCPVTPWSARAIGLIRRYAKECGAEGYDEATGKGVLRHVVIRELAGKYIVTFATTGSLPQEKKLVGMLKEVFADFTLWHNKNASRSNVIFGKEFRLVYGAGVFGAEENGIRYSAGANTFVQVNGDIRGKLYEAALSKVSEDATVIDCYAGGGLLTAMFAKKCRQAYGIEIVPEAVACADALKRENGLVNMENHCGSVEEVLPRLMRTVGEQATLTVDPPRKGLERSVVSAIAASGIKRVVMISCNPATLARDLGLLTGSLREENGAIVKGTGDGAYRIESVEPFDMFPQTSHVETMVVLRRNQGKNTPK